MLRFSLYLSLLVFIMCDEFRKTYTNIPVDSHHYCVVNKFQKPIFKCFESEYIDSGFNATHSWYTKDNLKCAASIKSIKKYAKFCTKRFRRGIIEGVTVPAKNGKDKKGNPIKNGNVFD
nr:uncharacterized protein LOC111423890 [Onthophagus taurus]